MNRLWILACGLACVLGCGQADVARVREGAAVSPGTAAADDRFHAGIVLCRRVGSKTGKRIAAGDAFVERPEKKNRYIHGFVDFANAPAGVHQVHLVWIKPGGREMFRKFAEVAVSSAPEGYRTEITWLKAEDLRYAKSGEPQIGGTPGFSLHTRLNVSPEKAREPGEYSLRVYWNRELLKEMSFQFLRSTDPDVG